MSELKTAEVEQTTSAPVEAPKVAPPSVPDEKFGAKFAALSRREKQIVSDRAEIAAQRAEFQEYKNAKAEARTNPMKYFESLGLSYDELTKFMLNGQKPSPEMLAKQVKAELDEYKKTTEEKLTKSEQDRINKEKVELESRTNAQVNDYKSKIGGFMEDNSAEYKLLKKNESESVETIFNVSMQYWEKYHKELSIKEATDLVNDYAKAELKAYRELDEPAPAPVTEKIAAPRPAITITPRTLTNSLDTSVPTPADKPMSYDESIKKAASILRFT